ncbi:response regulator transcription factor [Aquincola sp. S2]|uniref:Response regulator transcription factor n=1 Tax=Pseudaquabacterium terrae TaxID=2732868 RepID=A0ABX2EMI0_9BURK|nr:LuxR C-terminal-related transcriptional regulator [Aquabacterium terrae]NRF69803.1 response regulator transcription factor [Aquabacterium terrae]
MKRAADLARLRTLASMGLTAEAFIPALLEALHDIIPSDRNLFDWTDAQGQLIRYYFEGTVDHEINQHYFENFHNTREAEVMPAFHDAVMGRAMVHSADQLDRPEFFRSALYNEIWRPQRLHTRTEAIVRGARGEPLGSLVLYRGPGERKFTRAEEALLAQIAPYVARGLQAPSAEFAQAEYVPRRGRRAIVCLDDAGTLVHLSPEALKILLLAHGGVTPDSAARVPQREDFPTLTALWQQHQRAAGSSPQGPMLTVDNAWGRFTFESCALKSLARGPDARAMLHVTVQHHEPMDVALRRALDGLALTPAQKEVCLLLRTGHSQAEIAALLGVSATTVADHVRKIYSRLDVHSVQELSSLILRLAA